MEKFFNTDRFERNIFILSLFIFALTFIIYGYRLVPDSGGYIAMNTGREPLYPLFLFAFRNIFKILPFSPTEDAYLYAISVATNFLAAFAVYFATVNIKHLFNLNKIITALIALIMLSPFFLTITFSRTGVVISCSIGTESLTLPLYYIYFTLLLRYVLNHRINDYISAVFISILLALTRGQMMVCFIINAFIYVLNGLYEIKWGGVYKKLFKSILIMITSFLIAALLSRSYYYIKTDHFMGNTYKPITASSGVLLAASEKDAEFFNDEDMRELYKQINFGIIEKGYRDNLYDKGLLYTGDRAEFAHDNVKFHISGPIIYNYLINDQGMESGIDAEIARDKIASEMMRTLLKSPDVIKNYLKIYAGYLAVGFIRSVAFINPVLNIYAVFVYIAALILLLVCFKRNFKPEFLFMFLALLSLTGFVTSVSLVIMPLSRYVIYNLPFLYAAMIICLNSLYKKYKN